MTRGIIEDRLRRFLLLLAMLVFLATLAELVLEEHTGETLQFIPFALCGLGLITIGWALLRPERRTVLSMRRAMLVVMVGGIFGAGVHLFENLQFEQEIRPNAAVGDVMIATLKGAAPLLAPGILIFGALIALAATYYHPLLGQREEA
ncbi:MAG: hypothetical protein U0521_15605 [Anaerolineae bacterium]